MKILYKTLLGIFLLLTAVFILKFETIKRLYKTIHLFDEEVIANNFRNMDEIYPVSRLEPAIDKITFPKKTGYKLPNSFTFNEEEVGTRDFLAHNQLEALMILHRDTVIFEEYFMGFDTTDTHISWSISKSIVSVLLGIAYDEGLFQLEEPITDYLPQFKGTGYDGVLIKHILQMSSGVKFNENYSEFSSDINRFGRAFAMGSSLEKFSRSLVNEKEPGTFNRYVSIDTQVLGMLLKKITGQSLTAYYKEKLWEPLGMQDHSEWLVDNTGMEVALGGLNMSLRDYTKIGQLVLHEGLWNGKQIVSREWIEMSTTPDAPHLLPGRQAHSNNIQGYGFQWWIPAIDEGDFYAVGIYDQYIYIHPEEELVITALSANHHFKNRELWGKRQHVILFKSIARQLAQERILNTLTLTEE